MQSWASLPRGAVVVTDVPELGERARRAGRHAVVVGVDCADADDLRQRWSHLTRRAVAVMVAARSVAVAEAATVGADRAQVNANTGSTRSQAWVRHILANLHHATAAPPAQALSGACTRVPWFVAGAGPSLSKNTSQGILVPAKGIAVTVNAASHCIDAQCVLTVEANDLSHKLSPKSAVKLYALSSPPRVFEAGTGPVLPTYTGEVSAPLERLLGFPRLATSVSGTTTGCALGFMAGADPIVLLGQDLAYTGGRVYADGTGHEADRVTGDGRFAWGERSRSAKRCAELPAKLTGLHAVESWDRSGEVMADMGQGAIASWLTSFAQVATSEGRRCVNATEGGRYLPGWEHIPLRDVLAGLPTRSITPEDVRAMAGPPRLTREDLREWLTTKGADAMLEAYSMGTAYEHMRAWRASRPSRIRFAEARAVRRQLDRIETAFARDRAELEHLCLFQASQI